MVVVIIIKIVPVDTVVLWLFIHGSVGYCWLSTTPLYRAWIEYQFAIRILPFQPVANTIRTLFDPLLQQWDYQLLKALLKDK